MSEKNIQKEKAKTTRQLTDELKYVVERNTVFEDKIYKMEELLKGLMEKYENNSDIISEGNKTEGVKKCIECNDTFQTKVLLKNHVKRKHKRTNPGKTIYCKQCCGSFKESWLLEIHLKTHFEAETFECEICHKVFQNQMENEKTQRNAQ